MYQIKEYMARRDACNLETMGFLGINLACICTVILCISSIM